MTLILTLQVLTMLLMVFYVIFWFQKVGNAISVLKTLESIKEELADERLALEAYQKENSDLTIRLLSESRTLRHCYRDCGQYQNDINLLRAKLNLPLIEFKPMPSPPITPPEVTG